MLGLDRIMPIILTAVIMIQDMIYTVINLLRENRITKCFGQRNRSHKFLHLINYKSH